MLAFVAGGQDMETPVGSSEASINHKLYFLFAFLFFFSFFKKDARKLLCLFPAVYGFFSFCAVASCVVTKSFHAST